MTNKTNTGLRWPYAIVMAVCLTVSVLLSLENVFSALLMATLGFAVVLLVFPITFYYGLSFAPLMLATREKRRVMLPVSIIVLFFFGYFPHYLAKSDLETAANLLSTESRQLPAGKIRSLEMSYEEGTELSDGWPSRGCSKACEILVASGQLDWVRIIGPPQQGKERKRIAALHGHQCSSPGFPAAADATCVIQEADDGAKADLKVRYLARDPNLAKSVNAKLWFNLVSNIHAVEVTSGTEAVLRAKSYFAAVPIAPAFLVPKINGMYSHGLEFYAPAAAINKVDDYTVLQSLGFKLDRPTPEDNRAKVSEWENGITPEVNRQLVAVLDSPASAEFGNAQYQTIQTWASYARKQKEWNPELLALAARLIRDDRFKRSAFIDQVFAGTPEVSRYLVPAVLDRIAGDVDGSSLYVYSGIVRAMSRMPTADLAPHSARIINILKEQRNEDSILLLIAGRLDIDPLPYLLPFDFSEANTSHIRYRRLLGACYSDLKWRAPVVAALKSAYASSSKDYRRVILKVLAAQEESHFAEEAAAAFDPELVREIRLEHDSLMRSGFPDCNL